MPTLDSSPPVNHQFIFLCGLHRSGRSVLNRILKAHPQISALQNTNVPEDEGEFVQNVYPKSRNYGGPGKFCFSPDAYLTESSRLVTNPNRVRLFAQWSPYWDLSKPFLMEKSGSNIITSRFLQAMFPSSAFIYLVRHPVAVALATDKDGLPEMPQSVEHWALAHKAMLADREKIQRSILVRYEDMIARPDHAMKLIYDFLGLPAQPVKEPVLPGINREYFKLWEDYKLHRQPVYKKVVAFADVPAKFGYTFDAPYVSPVPADTGKIK